MRFLLLDFETVDEAIGLGLGAGWVFAANGLKTLRFEVVGWSTAILDTDIMEFTRPVYCGNPQTDALLLFSLIDIADGIIAHNVTYELGCLKVMGIDVPKDMKIFDTKIMGQLYNNEVKHISGRSAFSLENLAEVYLPRDQHKAIDILIDSAIDNGHVLPPTRKDYSIERFRKIVEKYCYSNMDKLSQEDVARYCNQDLVATGNLFIKFMQNLTLEHAEYWSSLQRITVDMRLRGNKIDMTKLDQGIRILEPEVIRLRNAIYDYYDINETRDIDSPTQLTKMLLDCGYRLPKSAKGNDSTNGKWMKENRDDPLIGLIIEYRSTKKILNDFFIKIKEMQKYTSPGAWSGEKYGRLFPELNILGANKTGRTSSSNPNEQNIPKRHEKYGSLIRSIFVCENPDNQMYVMDYSNQEGRLQIHYAYKIAAKGSCEIQAAIVDCPTLDLHKLTYAKMFNMDYHLVTKKDKDFVKPINLGLSYGMQSGSLARAIGKPTVIRQTNKGYSYEVAGKEAQEILDLHREMQPYVYELIDKTKASILKKGYITTIGGRKLYKDQYKDYTAISKLIQGSAGDLGYAVFKRSYEQGILPLLFIHDEFVVEGLDNAKKVHYNMVNAYELSVPMIVETKQGYNWGETKLFELNREEIENGAKSDTTKES